jgi:hypothetical protein
MALASFIIDAHSSLSNAFVLHRFTPSSLKSSSTSFIHLSLSRRLPLHPSNFPSKVFFTDLVSFILTTCPSHSILRIFITFTIYGALYLVVSSSFVLILHCQPLQMHMLNTRFDNNNNSLLQGFLNILIHISKIYKNVVPDILLQYFPNNTQALKQLI